MCQILRHGHAEVLDLESHVRWRVKGLGAELDDAEVGGLGDEVVAPKVVNKGGDFEIKGSNVLVRQPGVGCLSLAIVAGREMAVVGKSIELAGEHFGQGL